MSRCEFKPCFGLCTGGVEPPWDSLSLCLSLSAPLPLAHTHAYSLSLSRWINNLQKKKKKCNYSYSSCLGISVEPTKGWLTSSWQLITMHAWLLGFFSTNSLLKTWPRPPKFVELMFWTHRKDYFYSHYMYKQIYWDIIHMSYNYPLKHFFKCLFIFERERERMHVSRGGTEREREKEEDGIWRWLSANSRQPHVGLQLMNLEIMTWAEVRHLTDWPLRRPIQPPI